MTDRNGTERISMVITGTTTTVDVPRSTVYNIVCITEFIMIFICNRHMCTMVYILVRLTARFICSLMKLGISIAQLCLYGMVSFVILCVHSV